jgi:hypothetical protein
MVGMVAFWCHKKENTNTETLMEEHEKDFFLKKNKKMAIAVALVVGLLTAGASAYFILPVNAKDSLKNGAAIVIRSFKDVFRVSKENIIVSEFDLQREIVLPEVATTPSLAAEVVPATASPKKIAEKNIEPKPTNTAEKKIMSPKSTPATISTAPSATTPKSSIAVQNVEPTPPGCDASAAPTSSISKKIIINEVAWMGSPPAHGETASKASNREWIELKNISTSDIDLSHWQLVGASGSIKIFFDDAERMLAGSLYLLERGDDAVPQVPARKIYSGGLANGGDVLTLLDASCVSSDRIDASSGWPGGDNTTKATLERDADGIGWHTSTVPGGTPNAENSIPPPRTATTSIVTTSVVATTETARYLITVSSVGGGTGLVSSTPPGILCGFDCEEYYASGTLITFSATPSSDAAFIGWTGLCGGMRSCSFTVASSTALTATFQLVSPSPSGSPDAPSHLVIAEIQIAAASSTNDFVKIFNPMAGAQDIGGWKLRKKAKTGTDSSLREFPSGSVIAAGGYFVWANSADGFSESIGANVSSTQTLAVDNSAALFDAAGALVDAVAWGEGTDQYVEGSAYPVNPAASKVLTRKEAGDVIVDTDNNANDFLIP